MFLPMKILTFAVGQALWDKGVFFPSRVLPVAPPSSALSAVAMVSDTEGLLGELIKTALGGVSRKAESHLLEGVLQYMTNQCINCVAK